MNYIKTRIDKNCKGFNPINKKKYIGEYPIICRSSWEVSFCKWCDSNSSVLEWKSEPFPIKYQDPTKVMNGRFKYRRYFPDFLIKIKDKTNKTITYVIEVKPDKETKMPINGKKKSLKTKLYEQKTYMINAAKFKAAEQYCRKLGYVFRLVTEKQLF